MVVTTTATNGSTVGGAGGGGAGGAANTKGCEGQTARWLCDDFESGTIDETRWEATTRLGGIMEVTDERAREGDHALHIHLPSTNGTNGLLHATGLTFPVADNALYGRAWVYVEGAFPPQHSRLISASGDLDGEDAAYRLDLNKGDLNSRYFTRDIHDNVQHGGLKQFGYAMPMDTWICIEWQYDGTQNAMRYWFDGQLQQSMTIDGHENPVWAAPEFDRIHLGWHSYQGGSGPPGGYDVFYDAVVIDDEQVGCGE